MKKVLSLALAILMVLSCISIIAGAEGPGRTYKNVIIMIGDGMGENHLKLAKQERNITLFMEENCDLRGQSKTRSHSNPVTDSAAGGTAISSGIRTDNGCVGVYFFDHNNLFCHPKSIAETALETGHRSGIVTTDTTDGATPASFSSHTSSRKNADDITYQQSTSDFDLIWGSSTGAFNEETATQHGFSLIHNMTEMNALENGSKSFGQFGEITNNGIWKTKTQSGSDLPTLSQMTSKAIELLDNENGFFLMVEGAHIDKFSHQSNSADNYDKKVAGAAEAVEEFDNAIKVAATFAKADGDTLVVVTADHETGGITEKNGKYVYTKDGHSGANVPLIVFGSDDFIQNGEAIQNRHIARRIAPSMGFQAKPIQNIQLGRIFNLFK